MNYNQVQSDLEEACADFQVPSTRFAAEQRLQEFGKRPDAIPAGKHILANSNIPTAQFFALRGIKDAVVASYAMLGLAETLSLRDELLQMAITNSRNFEAFVLDSLCWVIAVITKRAWVETSEDKKTAFTQALYEDIVRHSKPSIGIIATTYLIDEFAGGSKCSEFHLPWEFHYSCKASFENTHMRHLFEAALNVLHSQLQQAVEAERAPQSGGHAITFERRSALNIAEKVLNWDFTSSDANKVISASFGYSRNAGKASATGGTGSGGHTSRNGMGGFGGDDDDSGDGVFLESEDQNRSPAFPEVWRQILVNNDVISMFFSVYEVAFKDRQHAHFSPGSTHLALQCIIQLSGLRGTDLFGKGEEGDRMRAEYVRVVMRNQLQVIRHICSMNLTSEAVEDDAMATTQMIRRLIETQLSDQPSSVIDNQRLHSLAFLIIGVPESIEYFGQVTALICTLLQAAYSILQSDMVRQVDEDFGDVDNYFVMQAFDELANAWSSIINEVREWEELEFADPSGNSSSSNKGAFDAFMQLLHSTAFMIRSEYVRLRMLICEIGIQSGDNDSQGSIMDQGLLEKDYVVYEDQLQFYALLARLDVNTAMDRALQGLRGRCQALQEEFRKIEADENSADQQVIDLLHEQIHWIILLIAHTLADSGTSERVLVPKQIIQYSSSCSSLDEDDVVQCIMLVLETLQFELVSPSSVLVAYCSPLLVETIFWTLRRVAPVYLFLDRSDYRDMSSNIVSAFGAEQDGGRGAAIIHGLLDLVRRTFNLWSSEEDVLHSCVDMMLAFSQRQTIAQEITRSPQFTPLIFFFTSNLNMFPESTHSSIIEALAVLSCHSMSEEHEKNFAELKTLILLSLNMVMNDTNFHAEYQDGRVIGKILDGLEMMDGILQAASFRNMDMQFDLFFEVEQVIERLLTIYRQEHSIILKSIQVVESAAKYLDISSLPDNEHKLRFSRNIRTILLKYQSSTDGSATYEVGADVEAMLEVSALMTVVSNLVHNEIGFAPNEASRNMDQQVSDDYGETEMFGLFCIHVTTAPSQLLAPNVMRSYMQLLSELVQYRTPSLIRWLPIESWKALLNMLIEGIDHDVYDVGNRTYETISKLGAFIKLADLSAVPMELQLLLREGIMRMLGKLLKALLFSPFDSDLVESAGTALVTLSLIEPAHLQLCFNELLAQGDSAAFAERLSATFAKFNDDLSDSEAIRDFQSSTAPIPNPIDGTLLRQPLFEFLVNTRAVLRVK